MYIFEISDICSYYSLSKILRTPPIISTSTLSYISFSIGNIRSYGVKLRHNASSTNKEHHFYFNRISRLWNSLPIIDLNLPINIIKSKIESYTFVNILLQQTFHTIYTNYVIFVLVAPVLYFIIL